MDSKLYNARLLPTYALSIYALAGIGFGEFAIICGNAVRSVVNFMWPYLIIKKNNIVRVIVGSVIAIASLWLVSATTFGNQNIGVATLPLIGQVPVNNVEGWVNWNFTGYQAKPSYHEFAQIIT
jgi:hypothetical protein